MRVWNILLLAVAMVAFSTTAWTQVKTCINRDKIISKLKKAHSESLVATGIIDKKNIIEIFATNNGSTWTGVFTRIDGSSCPFAAGKEIAIGNLGKIINIDTNKNYFNIAVVANITSGRKLVVITDNKLQWKMFIVENYTIIATLKGGTWNSIVISPSRSGDPKLTPQEPELK